MKMSSDSFAALQAALVPFLKPGAASERDRWYALWQSGFNVMSLYRQGLDDTHIDTALRRIYREEV